MPVPEKEKTGFTLSEWLIVLLILVAFVGVVFPVLSQEDERGKNGQAFAQLRVLADATFGWFRDTRAYSEEGGPDFLTGPGNPPALVGRIGSLHYALSKGNPDGMMTTGELGWKGPYLEAIPTDPWGNAFILHGLRESHAHLWILCAGPNGKIETQPDDEALNGDDLGFRMR